MRLPAVDPFGQLKLRERGKEGRRDLTQVQTDPAKITA